MTTDTCDPWHCQPCDVGGYTRDGWESHGRAVHPAEAPCAECGAPLDTHWQLRSGCLIHPLRTTSQPARSAGSK